MFEHPGQRQPFTYQAGCMSILDDFDRDRFYLGKLCPKAHEYKNTGKTLRYGSDRSCCSCKGTKTLGGAEKFADASQKFWASIDKESSPDGCWLWTRTIDQKGYGILSFPQKSKEDPRERSFAHRFSWYLSTGVMPPRDIFVCHRCDNPRCVNPEHLFLGTIYDNIQDCVRKDRHARGQRSARARFTDEQILEIRAKREAGASVADLAEDYGTYHTHIRYIAERKIWKHLP